MLFHDLNSHEFQTVAIVCHISHTIQSLRLCRQFQIFAESYETPTDWNSPSSGGLFPNAKSLNPRQLTVYRPLRRTIIGPQVNTARSVHSRADNTLLTSESSAARCPAPADIRNRRAGSMRGGDASPPSRGVSWAARHTGAARPAAALAQTRPPCAARPPARSWHVVSDATARF